MGSPDQAKHGTRHAGNKFLPPAHNMKAMYCAALFLAMAFVGDAALPAMRPSTELIDLIGKLEEAAEAGAAAGEQISNALSQLGAMADSAGTAAGSGVVVGTFAIDYAEDTLIASEATIVSSLNTIRHRCPDVQQRVDHTLALVDSLRTMLHDLKVGDNYEFTRPNVKRMEAAQVEISGFEDVVNGLCRDFDVSGEMEAIGDAVDDVRKMFQLAP